MACAAGPVCGAQGPSRTRGSGLSTSMSSVQWRRDSSFSTLFMALEKSPRICTRDGMSWDGQTLELIGRCTRTIPRR